MKKRIRYCTIKDIILEEDKTAVELWAIKNVTAKYIEQSMAAPP